MKTYRVTVDTLHEQYVYEVMAENELYAEIQGTNMARDDGWTGSLADIRVEDLT